MEKYQIVNISEAFDGRVVMKNLYWCCKDGDRSQAIFFNKVPQANQHVEIAQRFAERISEVKGWDVEVVFFETAFRPNWG